MEYWNKHFAKSLGYSDFALKAYPKSEDFVIRKAKALNARGRPVDAIKIINTFRNNNSASPAVLELETSIKQQNSKNRISTSYTYINFDKRFDEPWHLGNITYGRAFKGIGTINIGANVAHRLIQTVLNL